MKSKNLVWAPKNIFSFKSVVSPTLHPRRTKRENRLIDSSPWGDADKDKLINFFDCRPLDKRKQGWAHKGTKFPRERSTYIKMMPPKKFLRTTYKEIYETARRHQFVVPSQEGYEEKVLKPKKIRKLRGTLKSKAKVHIPFLEYDEQGRPIGHEGRHRAKAAELEGVKLIPVTIARKLREPRDWKDMRKTLGYKKMKHDWRMNLESEDESVSSKSADIPISEQRRYGEERPEILAFLKESEKRKVKESDFEKRRRLKAGYTKIEEIDARAFKESWEKKHGEPLDWSKERLRSAKKRKYDDSYPRVSTSGEIEDGRHRIAAAAKRREKIDIAIRGEEDEE